MSFKLIFQKNKNRNSYLDSWAEGDVLFFPLKLANPPKWRKLNRIGNLNWELSAKIKHSYLIHLEELFF